MTQQSNQLQKKEPKHTTESYRARGINLVISRHMVHPDDVMEAIDILVNHLGKMIEEDTKQKKGTP